MIYGLKNKFHFSIDDVFDCLIEVTDSNIPIFTHQLFGFINELNQSYQSNVGLNLFYQKVIDGKLRTLTEVKNLRSQLDRNPIIRFAPHAQDYATAPYGQSPDEQMKVFEAIFREIDRFGGQKSHAKFARLHYYSESFELANYFRSRGIKALFSTDRDVGSHRMPVHAANKLLEHGMAKYKGMDFIRTQFRVEFFVEENLTYRQIRKKFRSNLEKYGFLVFYTHEKDLNSRSGQDMTRLMFKVAKDLGVRSLNLV